MNDILDAIAGLEETPGQILKSAREVRQISIGEIAQRLLLSKTTIVALEKDDYSRIPAPVYAEGYLKAYAKFLQIPIDSVLTSFRSLNIYPVSEIKTETNMQNQTSKSQELPKLESKQHKGHAILGVFAILILGILAVFIGKQFFGKSMEVVHEVIHVPNNSANQNDNDKAPPITTASNPESAIVADSETALKNESDSKKTEKPEAQNVSLKQNDKDKIISDNQMPIITTVNSKNVVMAGSETIAKKTDKSDAQNVSLMLDTGSVADKSSTSNEPNLILTKPVSIQHNL
jgi:cytoskeleton protein RodZ